MKYNIENIVRDNKVFIVGTLDSYELSEHQDLNGSPVPHIRGKVVVVSNIANGEPYTYTLNVFQYKNNTKGTVNRGYTQLKDVLDGVVEIGTRVRVSAGFTMVKFKDDGRDELVEANRLSLRFISPATVKDTQDVASFEIGGFVYQGLTDKTNQEGDVYLKELQIMQTNYATSADKVRPVLLKVHVAVDDFQIASAIEGAYVRGATIKVTGNLEFIQTEYTKTEEVMFGAPSERTYYTTQKVVRVTGGSSIYTEPGKAYTSDDMRFLMDKYQADSDEIMSGTSNQPAATGSAKTSTPTSNETMFLFPQGK